MMIEHHDGGHELAQGAIGFGYEGARRGHYITIPHFIPSSISNDHLHTELNPVSKMQLS